jgi:hypothetical protein
LAKRVERGEDIHHRIRGLWVPENRIAVIDDRIGRG